MTDMLMHAPRPRGPSIEPEAAPPEPEPAVTVRLCSVCGRDYAGQPPPRGTGRCMKCWSLQETAMVYQRGRRWKTQPEQMHRSARRGGRAGVVGRALAQQMRKERER